MIVRLVLILALTLTVVSFAQPAAADPSPRAAVQAVRLAIHDLMKTFPERYQEGARYLRRLDALEKRLPAVGQGPRQDDASARRLTAELAALSREALLANPLLDFDRLLVIQRKPKGDPRRPKGEGKGLGEFLGLPRQSSWQQDTIPNRDGWENEIAVLSRLRSGAELRTLFRPPSAKLVGDIDLHFDADKILFSMPDERLNWQVYQIDASGGDLRRLSPAKEPGVHNFDPCYLPDGGVAFVSTAPLQGVPCNTSVNVAMAYRMKADGSDVRQLCFDQDHNYCLTVANDGRILYLRWEYTDIPHVWGRYLFAMNPDGTGQKEMYGTGSYWPNAIFYARPIPNHPTKIVGIVTGHHVGRVGELLVFDLAKGRNSTEGVIQRIPGRGRRVEPVVLDRLTEHSWPKFLHPFPLSEKYFLVAAKPTPGDLWGIYLVDVFDNMTLLKEVKGQALLEPIPFRKRKTPPVIPDRVDRQRSDAVVYLENVYKGPGLVGVPHGSVKKLRLYTYHFAYQRIAGINHRVGTDGPWEPKRVLGTVPVEKDGSALFRVPANTPISMQPLDAEGKALQLMRSWTTAMPGETVSCVGCHEHHNTAPTTRGTIAVERAPSKIEPWHGPTHGFSFRRDVQPVLDKFCVACHDGTRRFDGRPIADLRADQGKFIVLKNGDPQLRVARGVARDELLRRYGGVFEPSYIELRRLVRVGGLESDIRALAPGEFHADTSELVQMLRKGHHGVKLDRDAWDRIVTWIDLNAPCHGTWSETVGEAKIQRDHQRRKRLLKQYAGLQDDPEDVPEIANPAVQPIVPKIATKEKVEIPQVAGWPFDEQEAKRRQAAAGRPKRTIDLGGGVDLTLTLIPAGRFVMGSSQGEADEQPPAPVTIEKPFWMGKFEVTNEQFQRFDPKHESRYEHKGSWSFSKGHLGWPLDRPKQPVVRVSHQRAEAFCRWLSGKIGRQVSLPSEAQWEYACRAGTDGPLAYGDLNADFSPWANMADATIRQLAYDTDGRYTADVVPRDERYNDGALVTVEVGRYRPNAWGLHDLHGNVWEWTRSIYRPYPYRAGDGRENPSGKGPKVVRGGSWYDRPQRCRSAFRLSYPAWQRVYNVGFRVVCEVAEGGKK